MNNKYDKEAQTEWVAKYDRHKEKDFWFCMGTLVAWMFFVIYLVY